MSVAQTNTTKCKGCYYCIEQCPKKCITISEQTNSKGYKVISVAKDVCIGCGTCFIVCPDLVFSITD